MSNKLSNLRDTNSRIPAATEPEDLIIRLSRPADVPAVQRLAALDSRPAPAGDVVLAEVRGELWAAVPVDRGDRVQAIADPFRPTAEIVRLLSLRAAQLRGDGDRRGGRVLRAPRSARQLALRLLP